MNHSAYACALLGKKALERERVLELLEEVPDLPERAEVYLADGHLFLELAEPREEEVWALAEVLEAFVLEAGPDSGGPGWAGTKEGSVELHSPEPPSPRPHVRGLAAGERARGGRRT